MEYCSDGDLRTYLSNHSSLTVKEIISIALQISECLLSLKEVGILHRDLRPANLLFT